MAYNQVLVTNVGTTNQPDGTQVFQAGGRQAEAYVRELGGKYYAGNYRGRVFMTGGAAAGITIPISSSTAPTFMVYNPIGSGIVMSLGKLNIGMTTITGVASPIGWGFISGLTVAPTSLTAMVTASANLGSNSTPIGQVYSAGTLATAATKFFALFNVGAATGAFPNYNYDHEGSLILQPGSLVHLCGTAAQTQADLCSLTWEEWPQ